MKSDAPTRTQFDSGTTKKRERNLRLVLVMISIATFLGLVSIGPSPQITPRTSAQPPPPSCVPPPAGLVSWWPGDGNASDIQDSNAGTLQNGATFAAGEVGLAFSVDGVDDFVEIPDTGNLSPATITLDAWVNPDTLKGASTGTRIISKDVSSSSCVSPYVVYSLEVRGDFGNKATFFFTTSDDVLHTLVGTSVIPIGSFSLLAATFDGSTAKIYVNGVLENSLAVSGTLRTSSAPVILGNAGAACRAAAAGLVEFDGLIDEVEIFGRALDASEITAIFNAGIAGKCKGCATPPANMVGWWPGDNNTAEDITPSPDNGTLNGSATVAPGEVANAFSLNGTTAYVSAPNVAKINFGTGDFSIDAWIKTSNANTTQAIVDKRSGDNVSVFTGYHLFTFQGNLGVQLADGLGGGITATNFVSATNVANGAFHHVAVTVDRNSATGGNLYVDGVSVLTFNPTGRPGTLTNTAELRFGRNCPNTIADNFFNGLIDEVELFNVALSQPEVVAIYNAGSQGKCKCTITCPANITQSNDPNQCGAVVTYPAPTASAGCGNVNCVPASGSFFLIGTTIVNCSTTAGPSCSFTVTVVTQLSALSPAKVWIGLKNSDDVGTNFDLLAEVLKNGTTVGTGQINNVAGGSSGFNNAVLRMISLALSGPGPVTIVPGDTLSFRLSVRITAVGGHRSGTARLWYDGKAIDTGATRDAGSRFDTTIGCAIGTDYFLRGGFLLDTTAGTSKKSIDVFVDRAVGGNPFKPFGTWSKTL